MATSSSSSQPAASAAAAAAAAAATAGDGADGPVLSVVSKRLRALRKKHNRILQMEESLAAGKTLNREQEEVLRSKPIVAALIDELERLRLPLSLALSEEISRAAPAAPASPPARPETAAADDVADGVDDLLPLVYFASLFEVKAQSDFTATMLTRTHERGCCLTYDYVTEDAAAADLLGEADLDSVSALGSLVTSRPAAAGVSHREALRACAQHARLWLQRADEPIAPGAAVTYAGVRAKLDRILSSDYFTAVPEMKAPGDVAAAVEKYGSGGVQIQESAVVSPDAPETEGSSGHEVQKDEQEDFQATECHQDDQSTVVDEAPKTDEEAVVNAPGDVPSTEKEQENFEADLEDLEQRDADPKDQQYIPRRSYQNQRSGGRGGGRRGYANGRGGRGGRGGGGGSYQNGRGQYYDAGYYPRNNYNNRGRGGRSGGSSMYNNHGVSHGGHAPPGRVELGANA